MKAKGQSGFRFFVRARLAIAGTTLKPRASFRRVRLLYRRTGTVPAIIEPDGPQGGPCFYAPNDESGS